MSKAYRGRGLTLMSTYAVRLSLRLCFLKIRSLFFENIFDLRIVSNLTDISQNFIQYIFSSRLAFSILGGGLKF